MEINSKITILLLTTLISVFGWISKNVYDSTQLLDKRLTIVESTLIDRTEAQTRLAVLEDRMNRMEKSR